MSLVEKVINSVETNDLLMKKARARLKDKEEKLQELKTAAAKGYQNQDEIQVVSATVASLKRDLYDQAAAAKAEAVKYCNEEIERLRLLDTPTAKDLTEDATLLNSGIHLTPNEVERLMLKPENHNVTMYRLFNQYADAHGIKLSDTARANFADHSLEIDSARQIISAMHYVEEWLKMGDDIASKNIRECLL